MKNKTTDPQPFNLFKLDSKKANTPKSWLWGKFDSTSLRRAYINRLKRGNQKIFCLRLSKELKCGRSTVEKYLISLKGSKTSCKLPLVIVKKLCDIFNPELKKKINFSISSLFFTNRKSQPIRAIHSVSEELSELIGAFVADGYFHEHGNDYYIKISEGKNDSLLYLSENIQTLFNFSPRMTFSKEDNTWNLWIKNKVICRYFENIFGIKPGKKAKTTRMPKLIKRSNFKIQKSFVKGVFTFDGCVKTTGSVAFCTISKNLMTDVEEVLQKDNISYKISYNKHKDGWNLESSSGRSKDLLRKWKQYFIRDTIKHKRISFFLGEESITNLKELENIFPAHHHSKFTIRNVYDSISEIKNCQIKDIMNSLKNMDMVVTSTPIYKHLHLLKLANVISAERCLVRTNKNGYYNVRYSIKKRQNLIRKTNNSLNIPKCRL